MRESHITTPRGLKWLKRAFKWVKIALKPRSATFFNLLMFKRADPPIKCDICGSQIKWVWILGCKERKMFLCDVCYAGQTKGKKKSKYWENIPQNNLLKKLHWAEVRERGVNRFRNGAVGW